MKRIILLLALLGTICSAGAQKPSLPGFKVEFQKKQNRYIIYTPEFERLFNELKEESIANDYYRLDKSLQVKDDIYKWIHDGCLSVELRREGGKDPDKAAIFGKSPDSLVPPALVQRVKAVEKERFANRGATTYFQLHALADNQGNVLATYFAVDEKIMDLMRVEELQAIDASVRQLHLDAEKINFTHRTNKENPVSKEQIAAWNEKWKGKTSKSEVRQSIEEFSQMKGYNITKNCTRGTVLLFQMSCLLPDMRFIKYMFPR